MSVELLLTLLAGCAVFALLLILGMEIEHRIQGGTGRDTYNQ